MQLGKEKALKDLCNLKSKINDVPIWKGKKKKKWRWNSIKPSSKEKVSKGLFFAARQLPREMSKSSHRQGGCAAQRNNKNPSRLMHYDPGLAKLGSMEHHQWGAGMIWFTEVGPGNWHSPVSGPSQALKWRKGRKEWDDVLGGEAESCFDRDHVASEVRRSDEAPALTPTGFERTACLWGMLALTSLQPVMVYENFPLLTPHLNLTNILWGQLRFLAPKLQMGKLRFKEMKHLLRVTLYTL